jgi:asparagine synthase (glutamine-hydrolysing)
MCGICGFATAVPLPGMDVSTLQAMTASLWHRGPDEEGFYCTPEVGLGSRRLSIIDLSSGQQPVTDERKTICAVFNGEIYNFQEVRRRLQDRGHAFRSAGDGEVIVHAYEEYGDRYVDHLNGMFAVALWDEPRRRLSLARDRLGVKPLYYWTDGEALVFGSELKALLRHPAVPRQIDPVALDQFMTWEFIPGPRTIFAGVRKLLPGHRLTFERGRATEEQYWELGVRRVPDSAQECVEELRALLEDAVRLQLVSDVPLGAFLSGGIDSSTVLAFMSQHYPGRVKAFSIGFDHSSYNELPYARLVARHFGAEHVEEVLQPDLAPLAERLLAHLDEPLADVSIFPTYLVSELARREVKVVLSGDGGDEILGGYDTYLADRLDRYYRVLPESLRLKGLPALARRIPPGPAKKGLLNKARRFVEGAARPASLQHARWMMFLSEDDKRSIYLPDFRAALNGHGAADAWESHFDRVAGRDPLSQQQYVDIKTYLPDDILTKVDRMSMAVSLEARVPLLDHRVVEFAWNLPPHLKLKGATGKVLLRRAMAGRLPSAVLRKPKEGFSIPMKHWLRGPLRPMMTELLSDRRVRERGYFVPECAGAWMKDHLEGRENHSHRLWTMMVLEMWMANLPQAVAAQPAVVAV